MLRDRCDRFSGQSGYSSDLVRLVNPVSPSGYDLRSIASRSESFMIRERNRGRLVLQAFIFWIIAPAIALSLLM